MSAGAAPQHAVIVHFQYGSTDLTRLFALERDLRQALADSGAGTLAGSEMAPNGGDGAVYMYGPDADALFAVVRPVLTSGGFSKGGSVVLRYGPPEDGVTEVEVMLDM